MVETAQLVQLMETQDAGAWSQILFGLARQLGFDQVLYGMVGSRHAQFERAFLRSNYSPAWREHYDACQAFSLDSIEILAGHPAWRSPAFPPPLENLHRQKCQSRLCYRGRRCDESSRQSRALHR